MISSKLPFCVPQGYKSGFSCTSLTIKLQSSSDQLSKLRVICLSSTLRYLWLTRSAGTSTVSSLTAMNFPSVPGVTDPVVELFRVCWRAKGFDQFETWFNVDWQQRVRMVAIILRLRRSFSKRLFSREIYADTYASGWFNDLAVTGGLCGTCGTLRQRVLGTFLVYQELHRSPPLLSSGIFILIDWEVTGTFLYSVHLWLGIILVGRIVHPGTKQVLSSVGNVGNGYIQVTLQSPDCIKDSQRWTIHWVRRVISWLGPSSCVLVVKLSLFFSLNLVTYLSSRHRRTSTVRRGRCFEKTVDIIKLIW